MSGWLIKLKNEYMTRTLYRDERAMECPYDIYEFHLSKEKAVEAACDFVGSGDHDLDVDDDTIYNCNEHPYYSEALEEKMKEIGFEFIEVAIPELPKPGVPELDFTFDFDWQNYDSMSTSGKLVLKNVEDDDSAVSYLRLMDKTIHGETSNDAWSFVPERINGKDVEPESEMVNKENLCWTIAACIKFLRENPSTREFSIEGAME